MKTSTDLTWVDLGGTQITDAGLNELKDIKSLTKLGIGGTSLTDAALKKLKKHLPDCQFVR